MAQHEKIRVMISSRSGSTVFEEPVALKVLRERLKEFIEGELTLGGAPIFRVWICEEDVGSGIDSWWRESKKEIRRADLILVLYTGEAGSQVKATGLGICHAELQEAVKFVREKVVTPIDLSAVSNATASEPRDRKFQRYIEDLDLWPVPVTNEDELEKKCAQLLTKKLIELSQLAVRRRQGMRTDLGNALDWSKLDFSERKRRIEEVLNSYLINDLDGRELATDDGDHIGVEVVCKRKKILFAVHAIPAAMTIAAAREMVGQPFVHDHELVPHLARSTFGPVHVIGCSKGVTEAQAMRIRGIPDCTLVKTDFGVYLADNIQKVQMFFLANCTDLTATESGLQEMFLWLNRAEELEDVVKRAQSRRKILDTVASELSK